MFETTPSCQKLQFLPDILLSKKEKKKECENSQLIFVRNVAINFLQLFFALIWFKHIRIDPLNKHLCTWKMFSQSVLINKQPWNFFSTYL